MSALKFTTSPAPNNGRLTERETAAAIGGNLGDLFMIRHGGPKTKDPNFPQPVGHTYDAVAVMDWVAARDNRAAQSAGTATSPPVGPGSPSRDRRSPMDRRAR
jgi:hypothetical protein